MTNESEVRALARVIRRAASLAMLGVWFAPVAFASTDPLREALDALDALAARYQQLSSVHLEAEAILDRANDTATSSSARGTVEYWESFDGRYRLRCATKGDAELFDDVDLAFDGETYRVFFPRMNVEFYQAGDTNQSPAALPNPFYLPVYFGWAPREECGMCRLKLSSLTAIRTQLRSGSDVSIREVGRSLGEKASLRIGPVFGREDESSHEIVLEAGSDGHRIEAIHRRNSTGEVVTTIAFAEWSASGGAQFEFPRKISMRSFDTTGSVTMRLEFLITRLELNGELDRRTFVPEKNSGSVSLDATRPVHEHLPPLD